MRLDPSHIEAYLTERLGREARLLELAPLGGEAGASMGKNDRKALKSFGYGAPVLLRYEVEGQERRAVLSTVSPNSFGHEYRSDRAANQILSFDTFNELPAHARTRDLGVILPDGGLRSIGDGGEFFLLTEYLEGRPYALDLLRLRDGGELTEPDLQRARQLAAYLVQIHARKENAPALYRRRLRDLVGGGEGIMGLVDSYPPDFPLADVGWLERIEAACNRWRWRLKPRAERLSQVHGDFHPFNILCGNGGSFWLLDRSRGAWGEPGDDVSCLAINYLFFSLQRCGRLDGPFAALWDTFWETYLEGSGDRDVLSVVAPFFAWRGLVVASPLWYRVEEHVRRALFRFVEHVLAEDEFDPARVNGYLVMERRRVPAGSTTVARREEQG
jgi:aminoglycoside phosphotransferase (APT) family kinase protein